MESKENGNPIVDRILLVLAACAALGIVALVDWKLETIQVGSVWRDYLIYNACVWFVLTAAMWTRIKAGRFRILFLIILALHWALSAVLTHLGISFLWSGFLALLEIFFLIAYGGQGGVKQDVVPTQKN